MRLLIISGLIISLACWMVGCGHEREEVYEESHYRPTYGSGNPPSSGGYTPTPQGYYPPPTAQNPNTPTYSPAPTPSPTVSSEPSWSHDVYRVRGIGTAPQYRGQANERPMARRGAIIDASRNFLEYARGLQIDSNTYVKDFVTNSDELRAKCEGWVKGGRVIEEKMNMDGSYEVVLEVPLWELWSYVKSVRRESY